jgi:hypothetical protein
MPRKPRYPFPRYVGSTTRRCTTPVDTGNANLPLRGRATERAATLAPLRIAYEIDRTSENPPGVLTKRSW